ncbi:MAG: Nif3-like dinuclear metal center hexameric protein [Oscillospiraceae bacterium]|nr:Nif3-like dinuclear metal center hexameric protein [Ruminococcus sp.]MDE6706476.1 Nif3-like dinuclear metal center hexameric protein [Oscillospiraceae bacterium]
MQIQIQYIYSILNQIAPFENQESWDNSGLLIGNAEDSVSGILITLDITQRAIEKAYQNNCNLIISHHPVIFSALKKLDSYSMPYQLIKHNISAICCHTNLDIAILNDLLANKLCSVLDAESEILPLMPNGLGRIIQLKPFLKIDNKIDNIAKQVKKALGCEVVRYSANGRNFIHKIGICSGSGASLLEDIVGTCDCLLTGDVKHDRWYKAEELDLALIDCGHYHTEIIMVDYLAEQLRKYCSVLPIIEHIEENPVNYV